MFGLGKSKPTHKLRARLVVEQLESRLVPYSVTGNAWPHPQLVTLSFVPDGTIIGSNSSGYIYSNLQATFNAKFGSAWAWQSQFLKAAQTWVQQTNINFAVVPDNGAIIGSGSDEQGDPNMGDIRISGYSFGNNNYLAVANMPPQVNNYSIAGDVCFNTGQTWNINGNYDIYTLAVHEFGHALGLDHSTVFTADMYSTYTNTKQRLNSDDIAGIRNIYSNNNPRSPDRYDAAASNDSFSTATDLSSQIDPTSKTALVNNLDITSPADTEYYTFTAPAGSSSTLTITVQSQGLSLLSPSLTVYNASQTQLATLSGIGQYGTTLTATVTGVQAGQQFYVKVTGADTSAFGTGAYALILNCGSSASPIAPSPETQTADGTTRSAGGGMAQSTTSGTLLNTTSSLLSGVVNLAGYVADGLLGTLLGISTTFGLGAGHGDPFEIGGVGSGSGVAALAGATPTPTAHSGLQSAFASALRDSPPLLLLPLNPSTQATARSQGTVADVVLPGRSAVTAARADIVFPSSPFVVTSPASRSALDVVFSSLDQGAAESPSQPPAPRQEYDSPESRFEERLPAESQESTQRETVRTETSCSRIVETTELTSEYGMDSLVLALLLVGSFHGKREEPKRSSRAGIGTR
jgi:hypothetical protein